MSKINDTATYPNTAPSLADHFPGTDVSDAGNDPNGESVTFTFQSVMDLFEANMAAPATIISSGTFADARIAASNVTQHQAALSITESQISDFGTYQVQLAEGAFINGDKTKLDGIEALADVTDTANVTAAGALMDSELTDEAGIKALDTSTLALLGANVFTGTQDFNGQQVEGMLNKVVTSVTGALTAADHSGNVLVTSGNVTAPTTAGFNCVLIAGGAHTVTFNGTTSAAMAAGDLMTLIVESGTVIHAVLTAAADKVTFS